MISLTGTSCWSVSTLPSVSDIAKSAENSIVYNILLPSSAIVPYSKPAGSMYSIISSPGLKVLDVFLS